MVFYLSSGDDIELNGTPRLCEVLAPVEREGGSPGLLVRLSPPLPDEMKGAIESLVTEAAIFPRYEGYSLDPVTRWPVPVYLVRDVPPPQGESNVEGKHHYGILAWGDLYQTAEDAKNAYYPPLHRK